MVTQYIYSTLIVNETSLENDMPSYTMMYSLQDGCDLVLYIGTHGRLADHKIFRSNAVCLTIGLNVAVIWRENTLHCGTRLRTETDSGHTKEG